MALSGEGLLALWYDVLPEVAAEWRAWHVREHMPDRMTVPGIAIGRRYFDPSARRHQTFMLYEAPSLAVFKSAPYLAQSNAPSAVTRKLLPSIRNILRGACRVVASRGAGIGNAAAAIRLVRADAGRPIPSEDARSVVEETLGKRGVIGAHLGIVDREITGIPTTEQQLRHDADETFDALLLIEGAARADVARAAEDIARSRALAALAPTSVSTGVYDLVYLLSAATAG